MKVAYLAPELPALSATFVYNEILALEEMGTEVESFSVHKSSSNIEEPRVQALAKRTFNVYAQAKRTVMKDNLQMLLTAPIRYLYTLSLLLGDMWQVGLFSRTSFGLVYRMIFAASLAKRIKEKGCDHLHVHFAHIPTDIAMYASSLSRIPFSVTAHANDIYERGWLLKQKVQRAAFFATISEFNKRYLANKGVDISKLVIIRCGVDPAQFSKRQKASNNAIPKIGVIGRLVDKKGIDVLINAVEILKQQGQTIIVEIAGSGPLEKVLMKQAEEAGLLDKQVRFLGSIPHAKVARFIKSLDAFVLPCKKDKNGDIDGIPVVLMEAMLSGVPVVSTALSGIPELVINYDTGLVVESGNATELSLAIKELVEDKELYEKVADNAVVKVEEEFSLYKNTNKLNSLFDGVK